MEFTATTVKKDFIFKIINDEICVPSKEMRKIFNDEVRAGGVNLKDAYCQIKNGEMWVVGMHISPYEHGSFFNREPLRDRKLLMHKREIRKLAGQITQKGFTLIPLSLYFSGQRVKVEVGLCRGKKQYDKRDAIAKAESDREIERGLKTRTNRQVGRGDDGI